MCIRDRFCISQRLLSCESVYQGEVARLHYIKALGSGLIAWVPVPDWSYLAVAIQTNSCILARVQIWPLLFANCSVWLCPRWSIFAKSVPLCALNTSSIVDRKVYDTLPVLCFTKTRPHAIVVKLRPVRFTSFATNQVYVLTPRRIDIPAGH